MSKLRFIALSGTTNVTQNCYLYEYGGETMMVDCGVGFPEEEMYGVDLTIPDFSYVVENKHKLKGIVISHGHEDHLGALPFLFEKVRVPIYATKLAAGFIEDKFIDYQLPLPKINIFDPEKDVISVGSFKISPFRVSHSIPDSVGFCIETPLGKVFHVSDYKFDWTPIDGRPFAVSKASLLASSGVLALASDSLGATTPGYTESEADIEVTIENIIRKADGGLFFSTISSNISRVKQALNVAQRLGKKVCFVGMSIARKVAIAKHLGYITYPADLVVPLGKAGHYPKNKLMYIISGSYGQTGSALYRLALAEHEQLAIQKSDVVIFSADPAPPGSKANVDFVVDKLFELGAEVHYYDIQENLHVSGHGSQKDIEMLMALVKPKYYFPIGGTIRHMKAYGEIARRMGDRQGNVFELKAGESVEFEEGLAKKGEVVPTKEVLVDGLSIGNVGNVILRDRHILAREGVVIVLLQIDSGNGRLVSTPEIISRGFVYQGKNGQFLDKAAKGLKQSLDQVKRLDFHITRDKTVDFLEKYFFEQMKRRPMILPVIVKV